MRLAGLMILTATLALLPADADGNGCVRQRQVFLRRQVSVAAPVPASSPQKAPCPVDRFQNMPSRNVANRGAFTNENTSCSTSMMSL